MVKRLLSFLALGRLLASVVGACGTGEAPSHTASGTEVHMNSTNFVQAEITIKIGQSVTLMVNDPKGGSSHELRNEIVEELVPIRGAKAVQNWTVIP